MRKLRFYSKRREAVTHWRGVVSRKNRIMTFKFSTEGMEITETDYLKSKFLKRLNTFLEVMRLKRDNKESNVFFLFLGHVCFKSHRQHLEE